MAEFKTKEEYEKWKAERASNPRPVENSSPVANTPPKVLRVLKKFNELQAEDKAREVEKRKGYICTNCLAQGKPKSHVKGSFGIEIVLWLLMVLPGLLYTVWRLTSKEKVCPTCGKPTMIPLDSPMGQKLSSDH